MPTRVFFIKWHMTRDMAAHYHLEIYSTNGPVFRMILLEQWDGVCHYVCMVMETDCFPPVRPDGLSFLI